MKRNYKLSELVFSEELNTMRPVNPVVVSRYRQAYRAGNDLGTPIIDADTNVIVSGNHRVTAMLEEYGEDHEITADARTFATKADMLKLFAEENVRHGMPLDGRSRIAIIGAMTREGVTAEEVAQILGISVRRVEELGGQVMIVRGRGKSHMQRYVPCKHGAEHMAGKTVSAAEAERHAKRDRGVPLSSLCRQITAWLNDDGWVDMDDAGTLAALEELTYALIQWREKNAVAA